MWYNVWKFSGEKTMHPYRTHTCNELRAGDAGKTVRLSGWMFRLRDHGGILFPSLPL